MLAKILPAKSFGNSRQGISRARDLALKLLPWSGSRHCQRLCYQQLITQALRLSLLPVENTPKLPVLCHLGDGDEKDGLFVRQPLYSSSDRAAPMSAETMSAASFWLRNRAKLSVLVLHLCAERLTKAVVADSTLSAMD